MPDWRKPERAAAWKKEKSKLPAWSPAQFSGKRANDNVMSHSAFVGDLDAVKAPTLADMRARCAALGWAYLLHATPSDAGPGAPERRCRIIVPYSEPVPLVHIKQVRAAVSQLLGLSGDVDPVTKDPARLYFFPCLTETGAPPLAEVQPGAPIDVGAALSRQAGIDLLVSRWPTPGGGQAHEAQRALAGGLVTSGWSEAEAVELICEVSRRSGDEDRPKRIATVQDTIVKYTMREPIASWRQLAGVLTTSVVGRVRSFLGAEGGALRKTDIVVSHRLQEMLRDTLTALGNVEDLYRKDYRLVQVVHDFDKSGEVSPAIHQVDAGVLRILLSGVCNFVRVPPPTKNNPSPEPTPVPPPFDIVNATARLGEWDKVPPLTGIVSAPCMREDGTIITKPGYDEATGYLFEGAPPDEIPDAPTQADAKAALDRLAYVFADFPFAHPSGVYVVIAACLTLFARAAFRPTPAFIFDASARGSGKTKLADAVAIIASGHAAERTTYAGALDPETEKMLCSAALEGKQILLFDNVDKPFGGGSLDKVLTTEDRVSFRVLGVSELRQPRWRTVIIATGNNMDLCADTASRSIVLRLEPKVEHPEERTDFHETVPFLEAVRRDRTAHCRDLLTILKAWAMAGRPKVVTKPKGVAGRFEAWFGIVPQALAYAGGRDICAEASAILTSSDSGNDALRVFFEEFPKAYPAGATTKMILTDCWPGLGMTKKHPELKEALEILCESLGQPSPTKLGATIRKFKGRVIGSKSLAMSKAERTEAKVWTVLDRSQKEAAQ